MKIDICNLTESTCSSTQPAKCLQFGSKIWPLIKVNNRRQALWLLLEKTELYVNAVRDYKNNFIIPTDDKNYERLLDITSINELKKLKFTVEILLEYKARRSLILKNADDMLGKYNEEDIMQELQQKIIG